MNEKLNIIKQQVEFMEQRLLRIEKDISLEAGSIQGKDERKDYYWMEVDAKKLLEYIHDRKVLVKEIEMTKTIIDFLERPLEDEEGA